MARSRSKGAGTGLVKRAITRIVTPGTLTEEALLSPISHNVLSAMWLQADRHEPRVGLAFVDVSTGAFACMTCDMAGLHRELAANPPAELLVPQSLDGVRDHPGLQSILSGHAAGVEDTVVTYLDNHVFSAVTGKAKMLASTATSHSGCGSDTVGELSE